MRCGGRTTADKGRSCGGGGRSSDLLTRRARRDLFSGPLRGSSAIEVAAISASLAAPCGWCVCHRVRTVSLPPPSLRRGDAHEMRNALLRNACFSSVSRHEEHLVAPTEAMPNTSIESPKRARPSGTGFSGCAGSHPPWRRFSGPIAGRNLSFLSCKTTGFPAVATKGVAHLVGDGGRGRTRAQRGGEGGSRCALGGRHTRPQGVADS